MAVEASSGDTSIWYALGLVAAAVVAFLKSYSEGHSSEGGSKKPGQLAVLETAELVDTSAVRKQATALHDLCRELKPLLDKTFTILQQEHEDRIEDRETLRRIYERVERIDNEIEVSRRVQERLHHRDER